MDTNKINLYNDRLYFTKNKLFYDNEIIFDFLDRYHNISALGVEQQINVFQQLIKLIYGTNFQDAMKAEAIIIFAEIFKKLSGTNTPASVLHIGDHIFSNTFAEVLSLFGKEHKYYEITQKMSDVTKKIDNTISLYTNKDVHLDALKDDHFSFVFMNIDIVNNNLASILSSCYRLKNKTGTIVCYGSDPYQLENIKHYLGGNSKVYQLDSRFLAILDTTDTILHTINKDENNKHIYSLIESKNAQLASAIQDITANSPASNDEWYSWIDHAINLAAQMESIAAEHYMLFENGDLKFQINEVKTALLDFKYEALLNRKHYDFFRADLVEAYNLWKDNVI